MKDSTIVISKNMKIASLVIVIILVALVSFRAGMAVGFHKARFSFRWGKNYERNFMGGPPPPGFFGPFGRGMMIKDRDYRNANGVVGKIISITSDKLVIKDRDNKENTIKVTKKTLIKDRREDIKMKDLKKDDLVIVLGSPSSKGVIKADLVRILPFGMMMGPRW